MPKKTKSGDGFNSKLALAIKSGKVCVCVCVRVDGKHHVQVHSQDQKEKTAPCVALLCVTSHVVSRPSLTSLDLSRPLSTSLSTTPSLPSSRPRPLSVQYVLGYKQTRKALRSGKAKLVIIANNAPPLRFVCLLACLLVYQPNRRAKSVQHLFVLFVEAR